MKAFYILLGAAYMIGGVAAGLDLFDPSSDWVAGAAFIALGAVIIDEAIDL